MAFGSKINPDKKMAWPLSDVQVDAISVAMDGTILDQSPSAGFLVSAWSGGCEALRSFAHNSASGIPITSDVRSLAVDGHERRYQLTLTPFSSGALLIVGRDVTIQESLTQALVNSRELLQDLVRQGADFGFETDINGYFTYAGPDDVMGYQASELIGKKAGDVFFEGGQCPLPLDPFEALAPSTQDALPILAADGNVHTMWVSSTPLISENGTRVGARGLFRDVTDSFESEKSRRQETVRLAMLNRITHLLRSADNVAALTQDSLNELVGALRAEAGWICQAKHGMPVPAAHISLSDDPIDSDAIIQALQDAPEWSDGCEKYFTLHIDGAELLCVTLLVEKGQMAAVLLARDTSLFPWSDAEHKLLESVVDNLAVALKQARMIEELERLSSTDELSGLLNRRAFNSAVTRRLAQQKRGSSTGCFLYVDLDHFKEVNDSLGHAAGDLVIASFGQILRTSARENDIVARLGGDEFGLWLDGTDESGAVTKSKFLLDQMKHIRSVAGAEHLRLSLSVGIASAIRMKDFSLETLSNAADVALYQAKKSGRSGYAIAEDVE